MTQNNAFSDAKASLLRKRIKSALIDHEKGYFSGTLIHQTGVKTRRINTLNRVCEEIREIMEHEESPSSLSHYKLIDFRVLGKKGDYYTYPGWPLEDAIKHYCVKNSVSIQDFLSDTSMECFTVKSLYTRSSDLYKMTSHDGSVIDPDRNKIYENISQQLDEDGYPSQFHEDYLKRFPEFPPSQPTNIK